MDIQWLLGDVAPGIAILFGLGVLAVVTVGIKIDRSLNLFRVDAQRHSEAIAGLVDTKSKEIRAMAHEHHDAVNERLREQDNRSAATSKDLTDKIGEVRTAIADIPRRIA